jgi:hypothetical protein
MAPLDGVLWIVQSAPFQRSMSGSLMLNELTAVQAFADAHETPLMDVPATALGGVSWTVQLTPFQRSASVAVGPLPTAVQAVGEVHDTPLNELPGVVLVGVSWTVQLTPFHCSTRVSSNSVLPWRSLTPPTAVQALVDGHEMASSVVPLPPGSGVSWIVQLTPFQPSANACSRSALST